MPDFERIRIGGGADLAPCVVGIGRHDRACGVGDGDDIALQVLDIGVKAARGPVVIIDIARRSVLIVTECQAAAVPRLRHQLPVRIVEFRRLSINRLPVSLSVDIISVLAEIRRTCIRIQHPAGPLQHVAAYIGGVPDCVVGDVCGDKGLFQWFRTVPFLFLDWYMTF